MKKRCSGCVGFMKLRNFDNCGQSGICDVRDVLTSEDGSCRFWKPIGYSRKDFKKQTQIEIRMEEQE